jgi:hypothetical protein
MNIYVGLRCSVQVRVPMSRSSSSWLRCFEFRAAFPNFMASHGKNNLELEELIRRPHNYKIQNMIQSRPNFVDTTSDQ